MRPFTLLVLMLLVPVALVAAFFFALAATLQQKGALGMGAVSLGSPSSFLGLAKQTWWLLGTLALLGGYAFQAVALANGRLAARLATVHGAAGQLVDGNDVLAVHAAATAAVARARRGQGPTLLECRTYRWRGHVGPSWDMDVGVQRKDELHEWLPRDPLARLASSLQEAGVQASVLGSLRQEIGLEVAEAIEFARTSPYPDAAEVLRHVYVQAGER